MMLCPEAGNSSTSTETKIDVSQETMMRALLPLLLLLPACARAPDEVSASASLTMVPLEIKSASGDHRFSAEAAITPAQQEKGLMFRHELAGDRGMIFPMRPPRPVSFWMKDTKVPLDMLMVAPDGRIATIHANRKPGSLEPASTGEPMIAVVEIAGGRAAALGIKEGDRVRWGKCPGGPALPAPGWDGMSFCPAP